MVHGRSGLLLLLSIDIVSCTETVEERSARRHSPLHHLATYCATDDHSHRPQCGSLLRAYIPPSNICEACYGCNFGVHSGNVIHLSNLGICWKLHVGRRAGADLGRDSRVSVSNTLSFNPMLTCLSLRLFSLVPLVFSLLTARRLLNLPREIHTASSLLTLTTRILIANPFLLALSPAVLLAELLVSLPFATLAFRLLLIGYSQQLFNKPTGWEWHVHAWANWAIAGTICVWLWTWGVGRGLLRVACAGVIGSWYYAE